MEAHLESVTLPTGHYGIMRSPVIEGVAKRIAAAMTVIERGPVAAAPT